MPLSPPCRLIPPSVPNHFLPSPRPTLSVIVSPQPCSPPFVCLHLRVRLRISSYHLLFLSPAFHTDDGKTVVAGLFEGKCLFFPVAVEPQKVPKIEESVVTVSIKSKRGKNAKVALRVSLIRDLRRRALHRHSVAKALRPISSCIMKSCAGRLGVMGLEHTHTP